MVTGRDRCSRWRQKILEPRKDMTDACRVLLFKLAEHMNSRGYVSVPRSKLAADLGIAPARVSERIKLARRLGYLDIVRRGRPGVTATYQAIFPDPEVRQPYQDDAVCLVRQPGGDLVRLPYLYSGSRGTPSPHPRGSSPPLPTDPPHGVEVARQQREGASA